VNAAGTNLLSHSYFTVISAIFNIINMLHDGRANVKGIGKEMWQGTMRSEGKRPRTTSVIDPPLHDSLRRELIHSR